MRELLPITKDFQSSSVILALLNPLAVLVVNGLIHLITVQKNQDSQSARTASPILTHSKRARFQILPILAESSPSVASAGSVSSLVEMEESDEPAQVDGTSRQV